MDVDEEAPEVEASSTDTGRSLPSIVEGLRERASVETAYGEPIEAHGSTVIPVAKVAYGFGGGSGSGPDGAGEGSGGGISVKPIGVVAVNDGETRFVRFGDRWRLAIAFFAGLVVGLLLGRRRAEE